MHELSICGSIKTIIEKHAAGRPVSTIHLQVGQLRQIVPDTLVYCWSLVSADGPLAGSSLSVEHIPGRIACNCCGVQAEIGQFPVFVCAACAGTDVTVLAGEEFLITSFDLTGA
jgi:hydrogenase nickel incorporation protein HypA/HybF